MQRRNRLIRNNNRIDKMGEKFNFYIGKTEFDTSVIKKKKMITGAKCMRTLYSAIGFRVNYISTLNFI